MARLSHHTTDWRHIGTVEGDDAARLNQVRVAMRDGAREYMEAIGFQIHAAPGESVCVSLDLVDTSPFLKLIASDNFCLDRMMGPGVSDFHERETRRIECVR